MAELRKAEQSEFAATLPTVLTTFMSGSQNPWVFSQWIPFWATLESFWKMFKGLPVKCLWISLVESLFFFICFWSSFILFLISSKGCFPLSLSIICLTWVVSILCVIILWVSILWVSILWVSILWVSILCVLILWVVVRVGFGGCDVGFVIVFEETLETSKETLSYSLDSSLQHRIWLKLREIIATFSFYIKY